MIAFIFTTALAHVLLDSTAEIDAHGFGDASAQEVLREKNAFTQPFITTSYKCFEKDIVARSRLLEREGLFLTTLLNAAHPNPSCYSKSRLALRFVDRCYFSQHQTDDSDKFSSSQYILENYKDHRRIQEGAVAIQHE